MNTQAIEAIIRTDIEPHQASTIPGWVPTKRKMVSAVGYWTNNFGERQLYLINGDAWFKKMMTAHMEKGTYCPNNTPWYIATLEHPREKRKLNKMTYEQLQSIAPDAGYVAPTFDSVLSAIRQRVNIL
jgi:hypothetical protein